MAYCIFARFIRAISVRHRGLKMLYIFVFLTCRTAIDAKLKIVKLWSSQFFFFFWFRLWPKNVNMFEFKLATWHYIYWAEKKNPVHNFGSGAVEPISARAPQSNSGPLVYGPYIHKLTVKKLNKLFKSNFGSTSLWHW